MIRTKTVSDLEQIFGSVVDDVGVVVDVDGNVVAGCRC